MDEQLYMQRSIYRELFNNMCADFSIFRLENGEDSIDTDFMKIEKKLWEYREKALRMKYEDIKTFDDFLTEAQAYLIRKEVFRT